MKIFAVYDTKKPIVVSPDVELVERFGPGFVLIMAKTCTER